MYAQSLVFLRFGCYVHNPDSIYTKASIPIIEWLEEIQQADNEWGYRILSSRDSRHSVVTIDVPSTMHHALMEFDSDYMYTNLPIVTVKSLLTAKKNLIELTQENLRLFMRITKTTPAQLVTVLESYMERIESNPIQPVTKSEIKAFKDLGVRWTMTARLPRVEQGDFETIYIVDEHHRVRCL